MTPFDFAQNAFATVGMRISMRIAILTTVHHPLDTRIFYKQAQSLIRAGHQVTLIARSDKEAKLQCDKNSIGYIELPECTRSQRPKIWWSLLQILYLYRVNFDVWHFHDPELLVLTTIWRSVFARHIKLIYDVHEDVPKDVLSKHWINPVLRKCIAKGADFLESRLMQYCDWIIAATDAIAKRIRDFGYTVTVIRNYPLITDFGSVQRHRKANCQEITKVIYAGSLTEVRGIRKIVNAVAQLNDLSVELTLLGEFAPSQFELAIRKTATKNVDIVGKVPFTSVADYLSSSDIALLCFQPYPNHVEAMPMKLFEYMYAGLPIVASDFPLWRKIIEESGCGLLVDPTSVFDIAKAIELLAKQPEMRTRMGYAGHDAVIKHFTWNTQAETLIGVYREIGVQIHAKQ